MARLTEQNILERLQQVQKIVYDSMPDGVSEYDVAKILNWQRRTANNYLRALSEQGVIYRKDLCWYSTVENELNVIRNQLVDSIDKLFKYLKEQ